MSRTPLPKVGEPIKVTQLKAGEARYRVTLDADPYPDGRRRQVTTTHLTLSDARAHIAEHRTKRRNGTLVVGDRQTFATYADKWLGNLQVRPVTEQRYRGCLVRPFNAFGGKRLSKVTREDVAGVVADMAAAGRSKRTADQTLFVLRSIFGRAVEDGLLARNPATNVKALGKEPRAREALTPSQVERVKAHLAGDDLFACWLLTLYGLRRSEVCGLRWGDVDLAGKTLTIQRGRVALNSKRTVVGATKTKRGTRVLPLPDEAVLALKRLLARQVVQLGVPSPEDYIAVDHAGEPIRPDTWSYRWTAACKAAGVPALTLHAARHTSVTTMRDAGVPDHIVAAWHGHDEVVMRRTYSHAHEEALQEAGSALTTAYGARATSAA